MGEVATAARPRARTNDVRSTTRHVVLVSGTNRTAVYSVPMEWDGKAWKTVEFSAPPRARAALAADPDLGVTVMFGGDDSLSAKGTGVANGETWVMGPQGWRMATTPGPPARDQAAVACDMGRRRLVLYGASPRPPCREHGARILGVEESGHERVGPRASVLEYDSARRVVLLYGGSDQSGPKNDLWFWDGANWMKLK